ncbi:sensor histidine kinase [Sediminitomix flava]|uniref:histidine kinase n=1 Tax=Sediminitomix flava TaxID=379075 RepID=A0A315ZF29_SEDFL|nr:HAMP domain-containing sensor histidine kinase [Sediminitomix flava]PWJ44121.1 signal transduction histidine kinase [Sediminitomix flava]
MFRIQFSHLPIIGSPKEYALEHQMLNACFFVIGIGSFPVISVSYSLPEFEIVALTMSSYTLICLVGYIFSKVRQNYALGVHIFTFLTLFTVFTVWMLLGGIEGIMPSVSLVVLVVLVQFYPKRYFKNLIIGTILSFLLFVILELFYSDLILMKEVPMVISIHLWAMQLFFVSSILILFKNEYHRWKQGFYDKEGELRNALMKEKELSNLKSQFIAMVSHQFRTPITVVQSSAEVLDMLQKKDNNETNGLRVVKQLSNIHGAMDRLTEMLEQISTFDRIEREKYELYFQYVDFRAYLQNILSNYKNENRLTDATIEIEVEGNAQKVLVDFKLIENCLKNLINNALKFDPRRRFPKIKLSYAQKGINIHIKDCGVGIPSLEKERVFEPFFRASNVANIKGTGMGLSITKYFISLHQGKICVNSCLDEGTEIIVFLPYAPSNKNKD